MSLRQQSLALSHLDLRKMANKILLAFPAKIQDHKLTIIGLGKEMQRQPDCEGLIVTVQSKNKSRSDAQNRLYWLYLTRVIDSGIGFDTKEELHEYCKETHLFMGFTEREINTPSGKKTVQVRRTLSTAALSVEEFGNYLTKIEVETGIPLPDPNTWRLCGLEMKDYL